MYRLCNNVFCEMIYIVRDIHIQPYQSCTVRETVVRLIIYTYIVMYMYMYIYIYIYTCVSTAALSRRCCVLSY